MPLIEPRRNEESPPRFELGDNEMELGISVHGEPGVKRVPMMKADDIVDTLLDKVLDDLKLESGENVLLYINGLGATRRASSTSCTTTLTSAHREGHQRHPQPDRQLLHLAGDVRRLADRDAARRRADRAVRRPGADGGLARRYVTRDGGPDDGMARDTEFVPPGLPSWRACGPRLLA